MSEIATSILEHAQAYREAHGPRIIREFAQWLAIPNVATNLDDMAQNASVLQAALQLRGCKADVITLEGVAPVVVGSLETPGATKTVLLYAHYDGQPANPDEWVAGPWEPTLFTDAIENGGEALSFPEQGDPIDPNWRLYARSASDDKAPFSVILTALDLLQNAQIDPKVNLKFFFDGEEELGSPHLSLYLHELKDRLEADVLLICDGPVHASRQPQLYFGARGFSGMTMTVYGPSRHLHSGHYGNWAPNPALLLTQLLATFKDEDGAVRIDNFYEGVEPIGPAEQAGMRTIPDRDQALRRELGLSWTESGNAPLDERILLPSLNIRGLLSGVADGRILNSIPDRASASLDARLVKGIDPYTMMNRIEDHISRQGFHIVREEPDHETRLAHRKIIKIEQDPGYPAVRTPMDLPIVQSIIETVRSATSEPVALLPTLGGSLPLHQFDEALGIPIIGVPIANHDNNQHGPNENIRIANLWYGIDLFASLFTEELGG